MDRSSYNTARFLMVLTSDAYVVPVVVVPIGLQDEGSILRDEGSIAEDEGS